MRQSRENEATETVFCLQAKKPLHSGSYEHMVPKIRIKQTFFCTRDVHLFICVIRHRNWPRRSTILNAHGTNASPDGLCTRTYTNEPFSCWFCGNSFRVDRVFSSLVFRGTKRLFVTVHSLLCLADLQNDRWCYTLPLQECALPVPQHLYVCNALTLTQHCTFTIKIILGMKYEKVLFFPTRSRRNIRENSEALPWGKAEGLKRPTPFFAFRQKILFIADRTSIGCKK